MAVEVLYDATLLLGQEDISGVSNEVALERAGLPVEYRVFRSDTQKRANGLLTYSVQARGFTDRSAMQVDDLVFDGVNNNFGRGAREIPISVLAKDGDGQSGYALKTYLQRYRVLGESGELDPYELDSEPSHRLVRGTNLVAGQKVAAGSGVARQLGAVSATQRLYASLHVVQFVGTTMTMLLQSDDASGFLSPVTQITFAAAAGKTFEWAELAGAVADTWWRASWSGTFTSFTAYLLVGILSVPA